MRRGTPAGRSGTRRTGRAEALASLADALFRETFPDIAPNAGVRVHPTPQAGSWHERLLVEGAGQRILLKVVPSGAPSRHRGSMATEHRMLTELAPRIRVNAISPSLTRTPLAASLLSRPQSAEGIAALHAVPRLGEPDDIAALGALLMSPESGWITGQVMGVDGGRSTLP